MYIVLHYNLLNYTNGQQCTNVHQCTYAHQCTNAHRKHQCMASNAPMATDAPMHNRSGWAPSGSCSLAGNKKRRPHRQLKGAAGRPGDFSSSSLQKRRRATGPPRPQKTNKNQQNQQNTMKNQQKITQRSCRALLLFWREGFLLIFWDLLGGPAALPLSRRKDEENHGDARELL